MPSAEGRDAVKRLSKADKLRMMHESASRLTEEAYVEAWAS
jgi:hypothetical protein